MKRFWVRSLAIMICFLMIAASLGGCSSKGTPCMELEGTELSVNLYQLFLSRMKGTLASGYMYGEKALKDSFWDTMMDSDGTTYNDHFTKQVLENSKTYLAALHVFEELGLELPQSYIDEIDEQIDELIENDADGSKTTFNSMLAKYGVNHKMLRDAYILEAKISYLSDHLYGADGSKISPVLIEDYYKDTYARFKHVFIYTYELVYETDTDGNDIWYSSTEKNKISYDTTAKVKKDSNGNTVKDKNGDTVYVNEDGTVAYDKANAQRNPKLDSNGSQVIREYTEKELIAASDRATLILEKAEEGNYTLFDKLVENYSEDEGMEKYTNGYYVTRESNYDSPEVLEALFDMKDGEIRRVDSEYGIHLVMRYELEEAGYDKKENADFFVSNNDSSYTFLSDLKQMLLAKYLAPYIEKIEIDESVLDGVDIKSVGANFYY